MLTLSKSVVSDAKIPVDVFGADPVDDMKIHGLHRQHNSHLTTVSKTMSQCRSHFSPQRRNAVTRATSTIIPKNDYRCEAVETSRNARPIFRKVVELSRWSQSYGKENDSDELAARGLLGGVAARGPIRKMPGRMAEHRAPLHGPYKCPSREKPVAVHQIRKPGLGIEPYYVCYKWPWPRLRGDARAAPAGGPTGR
ncbi:uncharacterized protein LOC117164854 [Bombus vancouverensis nearcticus]|uniref:uncharacterized protein LOC117164854 n=1 Tax=Bombus vancouverensis nearcticus TaxID=2705178 RepID=UPI00402BBD35